MPYAYSASESNRQRGRRNDSKSACTKYVCSLYILCTPFVVAVVIATANVVMNKHTFFGSHSPPQHNGNNNETGEQKILSISLRSDLHLITIMYQILWIQSRETISVYFSLSVGIAKRWMLCVEKRKRENSDIPLFVFGYSFC